MWYDIGIVAQVGLGQIPQVRKESAIQPRPTGAAIPVSYHVGFKILKGVLPGITPAWQPLLACIKAHMLYKRIQHGFSSDKIR